MDASKWTAIASIVVGVVTVAGNIVISNISSTNASHVSEQKKSVDEAAQNITATIKGIPLGTIVSSYLNFNQFNKANGDGSDWTPKSTWVPADGRKVISSLFQTSTNVDTVPDLRGLFLRGLNEFDINPAGQRHTDDKRSNPEIKKVGEFQEDAFQGHGHQFETSEAGGSFYRGGTFQTTTGNNYNERTNGRILDPITIGKYGAARITEETRPKNISVYYYIKIN